MLGPWRLLWSSWASFTGAPAANRSRRHPNGSVCTHSRNNSTRSASAQEPQGTEGSCVELTSPEQQQQEEEEHLLGSDLWLALPSEGSLCLGRIQERQGLDRLCNGGLVHLEEAVDSGVQGLRDLLELQAQEAPEVVGASAGALGLQEGRAPVDASRHSSTAQKGPRGAREVCWCLLCPLTRRLGPLIGCVLCVLWIREEENTTLLPMM